MIQQCVVYKKIRKYRRNLSFARLGVLKWRHNRSQSPVFGLPVLYPTGSEIWRFWYITTRGRKIAIEIFFSQKLISTLGRLNRANKKSMSYTLSPERYEEKLRTFNLGVSLGSLAQNKLFLSPQCSSSLRLWIHLVWTCSQDSWTDRPSSQVSHK